MLLYIIWPKNKLSILDFLSVFQLQGSFHVVGFVWAYSYVVISLQDYYQFMRIYPASLVD